MLTDKNFRFCQEYIIDLNATQSAIRSGYSEDTAGSIGHELLKKPEIQAEIGRLQEERAKRTQITADRVIVELGKVAFANIQDYLEEGNKFLDAKSMEADKSAAIESIHITETEWEGGTKTGVKFKLHDKISALEKIGRHLGIFEKDNEQQRDIIKVSVKAVKRETPKVDDGN